MGASGWDYLVSYQLDIEQVLRETQASAFEEGAYRNIFRDISISQGIYYQNPTSIMELRDQVGENGTHSIIDIYGVSDQPREAMISPLTDDQILELFGTLKPKRLELEQKIQEYTRDGLWIFDFDDEFRDFGYYVIIYDEDHPTMIFISGMSGD